MRKFGIICLMLFVSGSAISQIEGDYITLKGFKSFGFGSFLNFAVPVSESDYGTLEGGFLYFQDNQQQDVGMLPVLVGYRYTLDRSGTGFWVEPQVGYVFGGTSVGVYDQYGGPVYDNNGNQVNEEVKGPMAGVGFGYLFQPAGRIQFNIGLRLEHSFGSTGTNIIALRISHAFTFRRRED